MKKSTPAAKNASTLLTGLVGLSSYLGFEVGRALDSKAIMIASCLPSLNVLRIWIQELNEQKKRKQE